MGQQQLLLLVLGIVLVGLAVVVGIQAFAENQRTALFDEMTADGIAVIADVAAWHMRPSAQGGRGDLPDLSDLSFEGLGYTQTSGRAGSSRSDRTGRYYRQLVSSGGSRARPYVQMWTAGAEGQMVQVFAYGPAPACILTRRANRSGSTWAYDGTRIANPSSALCRW